MYYKSAMYYETKLQISNFTLFNLATKQGYCYCWDETEANLSSDVFAYLWFSHFDKVLQINPAIEKLIIWRDGCGLQKYLVAGHTQMECDSMHSTIKHRSVCDIFTPCDHTILFESECIRPSPYFVKFTTLK